MPTLPQDVLIIHYADLAPGAPQNVRLCVLAAIGRLLDGISNCTLNDLTGDRRVRSALRMWLVGEYAARFWRLDGDVISPLQVCNKHILVGTKHLLSDLAAEMHKPSGPKLADLDVLWQAANHFLDQRFNSKSDVGGAENG